MDLNLALFRWLAAGHSPHPWVLPVAAFLAMYGPWLAVAVIGHAIWRRPAQRPYLLLLVALAGATSLASHAIAEALQMLRPFALGLGPPLIPHGNRFAMPSTHAAVMSLLVAGFALEPALRGRWALLAAATAATCWARIYVNVHFPLDVLGGVALGTALMVSAWLVTRMLARWHALIRPAPGRLARHGPRLRSQAG